jgi:hypothetical protein
MFTRRNHRTLFFDFLVLFAMFAVVTATLMVLLLVLAGLTTT